MKNEQNSKLEALKRKNVSRAKNCALEAKNVLCYAHTAGLPWTFGLKSILFKSWRHSGSTFVLFK